MITAAKPWIEMRLMRRGVFEEGGKWKADLHGENLGNFANKAAALKAYRAAAEKKFGNIAALPTDEDIDATLAQGDVAVEPQPTQPQPKPPQSPPQPRHEPKPAPKPAPKQQAKPPTKPAPHRR